MDNIAPCATDFISSIKNVAWSLVSRRNSARDAGTDWIGVNRVGGRPMLPKASVRDSPIGTSRRRCRERVKVSLGHLGVY